MGGLWQDVRFAARVLIKGRWFTAAAIVALALGIGANNAVFTIVNGVLLRHLPFDDGDRIMWIGTRDARGRDGGVSFRDFEDYRAAQRSFSSFSLTTMVDWNLVDPDRASETVIGGIMSAEAFTALGVQPAFGRTFTPEDDRVGAAPVAVLGNPLWRTRYGGDPSILGRTINVSGTHAVVIGVMPERMMKFPFNAELWLPYSQFSEPTRTRGRQDRFYMVFGRLADGVAIGQARAELAGIGARLAQQYPDTNKDVVPTVTPFVERMLGRQIRLMFWALQGAVGFVLLIACANVANLLLARAAHRSREISVRVSLGATRWRIVRQLLVESVLLAFVSGAVGFAVSLVGIRWFDSVIRAVNAPAWMVLTLDARVFAFFAVVCVVTGIVFGLAPALHISKTNVSEVLKEGGRSGSGGLRARRWTAALIVVELTATLVLLAGAGFMLRSFLKLYRPDLGVETSRLMTMSVRMQPRKYLTPESRVAFLRQVDERLNSIAAIGAVTTATNLPLGGGTPLLLEVDGRPPAAGEMPPTVTMLSVSPRYFEVLGLRLLRGRTFTDRDGPPGHESAIVNQRFAAMHFPGEDPIGRRIRLTPDRPNAPQAAWLTIVGVSPTLRQRGLEERDPDAVAYIPHVGNPNTLLFAAIIVRSPGEPGKVAPLIREELKALDPDAPVSNVRTMEEWLALVRWFTRTFASMFTVFAAIALVLSAVGLYAVTAYSVSQRTQEIGVRMALGAQPPQVWWLVLRRGLWQLGAGVVLGLGGAVGVGRLIQSMLIQTEPADPITLASIVVVLVVVGVAACLWPARQATRLDPAVALRYE
jgi:predicted permease